MEQNNPNIRLILYSILHFLCDLCCCALILNLSVTGQTRAVCLLVYNFCAFAMQLPMGMAADAVSANRWWVAGGSLAVAAATALSGVPLLAAVLAGLGNGAFHIGGGIDTLNTAGGKSARQGIFVAPGALGLFIGARMQGLPWAPAAVFVCLALAGALWLCKSEPKNAPFALPKAKGNGCLWLGVSLLFGVVVLRSLSGMLFTFSWKSDYALWFVLCVVLGKVLGGFAADWLGGIRSSLLTLGLAAVLFCFAHIPVAGLIAVLLFNMTMPVTLTAAANLTPGAKGMSFGLMTFGLFLGYFPVFLGLSCGLQWVYALLSIASLALIVPGLAVARKKSGAE